MKQYLSRILCLIFLLAMLVTAVIFNATKPRVMILQSYSPDYPWTRDIDVGLHRVVDDWPNYSVTWHYMDTKRNSDVQWLNRAGLIARRAINRNDPHVLIAVDDLAQELAAKYFVNDPDMQIVFAGINASAEPYGYNEAENVTGIFERKQLNAVKETILALESRKDDPSENPRVLYVLDTSPSLLKERVLIDNFSWQPIHYLGSSVAKTFVDWREIVKQEGDAADYIIVANYRKLSQSEADPSFVVPQEVMDWTADNTDVPVVGMNSFNVEDGAALSIGVSPFEQGEVAAKMAELILKKGIKANKIPMVENKQYVVAIRESALELKNMELPAIYEAFGRATENYFEE